LFDTVHPVFPEYLLERDVKINHPNGMRVLMVAQDDKLRVLRAGFLGVSGFDVVVPGNTEEAAAAIWTTDLDAMLLSYSIPSRDAVYLAQLFRAIRPHGCLIGISADTRSHPLIATDAQILSTATPETICETIRKKCVARVA
jgi:CheY-like chemotaxis protein